MGHLSFHDDILCELLHLNDLIIVSWRHSYRNIISLILLIRHNLLSRSNHVHILLFLNFLFDFFLSFDFLLFFYLLSFYFLGMWLL